MFKLVHYESQTICKQEDGLTEMPSCYSLQTELQKGNVFTSVCQEFCP